jgi:hypothetical protein
MNFETALILALVVLAGTIITVVIGDGGAMCSTGRISSATKSLINVPDNLCFLHGCGGQTRLALLDGVCG